MKNCGFESELERFLDSDLSGEDTARVSAHVAGCVACSAHVKQLRQIEQLVGTDLLSEPGADYWENLPGQVLQRIQRTERKLVPTMTERFLEQVSSLFAIRGFQIGFAGAMAAFLIFMLTRGPAVDNQQQSIVTDTPMLTSPAVVDDQGGEDLPGSATAPEMVAEGNTPNRISVPELASQNIEPVPASLAEPAPAYLVQKDVSPLVARTLHELTYEPVQQMLPLPNYHFILPSTAGEAPGTIEVTPSVFGDDIMGDGDRNRQVRTLDVAVPKQENDFAETAWIVQESTSLAEKKAIWLSYLEREQDPTYRSLALYNLGLVLEAIAQETLEPEHAGEALRFFEEHESALRFQIGQKDFGKKIEALRFIAKR